MATLKKYLEKFKMLCLKGDLISFDNFEFHVCIIKTLSFVITFNIKSSCYEIVGITGIHT